MSLTYGFYNSLNHDRRYNAIQMSSIFDGIILDGIFMTIGDCFQVKQNAGMMITVGSGRAWFNHTWTLNDALLPLSVPDSEILLNRIDAVVLEINAEMSVRENSIKIVKGTPASSPQRPAMVNTANVHQYPLAYIAVNAGVTEIRQANITSMIGTGSTPYVTGPLKGIDIGDLVAQWEDQWKEFYEKETDKITSTRELWDEQWRKWFENQAANVQKAFLDWTKQWETWFEQETSQMTTTREQWEILWETWYFTFVNSKTSGFTDWINSLDLEFRDWWNSIKDILDNNPEAKFSERLVELEQRVKELEEFKRDLEEDHAIYSILEDSDGDSILDSNSDPIRVKDTIFITRDECDCWVEKEEIAALRSKLDALAEKIVV